MMKEIRRRGACLIVEGLGWAGNAFLLLQLQLLVTLFAEMDSIMAIMEFWTSVMREMWKTKDALLIA